MKVIFIFIDGFGIGKRDSKVNPVFKANVPILKNLIMDKSIPTDPCLGVKGLPQSATGQTSIFTGFNAPRILDRHLSGQPTVTLRNLIKKENIVKQLKKRNLKFTNANVYRSTYLAKMLDLSDKRYRPSVTSVMCMAENVPFRTVEDYKNNKGIYHDITGKILAETVNGVKTVTPEKSAENLFIISRNYDFTLYEHFMTDIIGHKADMSMAVCLLEILEAFFRRLFDLCNLKQDIIFITSDHGNIEDISVKTHTMNPGANRNYWREC